MATKPQQGAQDVQSGTRRRCVQGSSRAGVYVSVDKKFNGVDLRRHWVPEGQEAVFPTKEGIYIPMPQWNSFKENLNNLLSVYPELFDAQECSHEISLDVIDCKECLPFGLLC